MPSVPLEQIIIPSNVHAFSLCIALRISTNGVPGNPAAYTYLDLPTPRGFSEAVLRAVSIELVWLMKGGPADNELEWNPELVFGLDRDNEAATAVALAPNNLSVNDTPAREAPITAVSSFLPHCRPRLRMRNKANVTGARTAVVTVIVLVKVST